VKECPLPSARTVSPADAADLTAIEMSSTDKGRTHRAGVAETVRPQFRHLVISRYHL
jgi:hypothetical protein